MQYTVKKPINNNILRVVDPTGCELIVTGRGLGFGVKSGYKIEAETVERSYRMTSPAVQQKLVELLEQIPYEHLLLTDELVAMIRSRVNYPLNESLLITLADHISFAIQRSEQGIRFSNPLMTSIREFYPEEFKAVPAFVILRHALSLPANRLRFCPPFTLRRAGSGSHTE